jgi:rod shape-determining protein MreC
MKNFFRHPFVLSLLVIAGLIFLNSQGWLGVPQNVFFHLTDSGQKIIYQFSLKINDLVNFLSSVNELNQENIRLKQENQKLLAELSQLKEVAQENEFLRQQMALSVSEPRQLILANVVGQNISSFGRYISIDKGEKDGVREKAAVIVSGNLLVGQIVKVTNSFSKVQLITDANSRVNARLQESRITGLVKGDQGLNLVIDLLPQGKTIEQGEMVITSGLAGFFPAGLLIGQIQEIISSDVQISQKAKIKPAVDFSKLEKVFVIKE